jgi:signal transduction histidine kinase
METAMIANETLQHRRIEKTLYDQDYYLWLQTTIQQLGSGQVSSLDLENLIEELASMGKSERRALESLLIRLLEHLLKLAYWQAEREENQRGWKNEIRNFRLQIKKILKESPSLKPYLAEVLPECYQDARNLFKDSSGIPGERLPKTPMGTLEQILDENWLPDF